jgi:hypothetical protein
MPAFRCRRPPLRPGAHLSCLGKRRGLPRTSYHPCDGSSVEPPCGNYLLRRCTINTTTDEMVLKSEPVGQSTQLDLAANHSASHHGCQLLTRLTLRSDISPVSVGVRYAPYLTVRQRLQPICQHWAPTWPCGPVESVADTPALDTRPTLRCDSVGWPTFSSTLDCLTFRCGRSLVDLPSICCSPRLATRLHFYSTRMPASIHLTLRSSAPQQTFVAHQASLLGPTTRRFSSCSP